VTFYKREENQNKLVAYFSDPISVELVEEHGNQTK